MRKKDQTRSTSLLGPVGEITDFANLASQVPNPLHRTANRVDPFWMGLWGDGTQLSWESRRVIERRATKGFSGLSVRDLRMDPDKSYDIICGRSNEARDALGVLGNWRTATSEQIAAFGGWSVASMEPNRHAARWIEHPIHLRLLWSAYMADRGRFNVRSRDLPYVWRLTRDRNLDRGLREMTFDQWLRITAANPITGGPRHDRHNLLGTELGLRVAEFCEVAAVLGESLCSHHLLDVSGRTSSGTTGAGDLMAMRTDGLRIIFETTASGRQDRSEAKVAYWLDMLANSDYDESGTIVCFVEAGDPDDGDTSILSPLQRGMLAALSSRPGGAKLRLRERVAVARWKDWFPGPDLIAEGFATLAVQRPTGAHGDPWEVAHLLDVTDATFDPPNPEFFAAGIGNASLLAGLPYWLRPVAETYGTLPDLDAWKWNGRPLQRQERSFTPMERVRGRG